MLNYVCAYEYVCMCMSTSCLCDNEDGCNAILLAFYNNIIYVCTMYVCMTMKWLNM